MSKICRTITRIESSTCHCCHSTTSLFGNRDTSYVFGSSSTRTQNSDHLTRWWSLCQAQPTPDLAHIQSRLDLPDPEYLAWKIKLPPLLPTTLPGSFASCFTHTKTRKSSQPRLCPELQLAFQILILRSRSRLSSDLHNLYPHWQLTLFLFSITFLDYLSNPISKLPLQHKHQPSSQERSHQSRLLVDLLECDSQEKLTFCSATWPSFSGNVFTAIHTIHRKTSSSLWCCASDFVHQPSLN